MQRVNIIKIFSTIILLSASFSFRAQPGKDGALSITTSNQILNHYIPVSVSIAAGSNVVTIANSSLFSLCPGDLIMIYQAQGANMNGTNTNAYGTITSYNSAGLYEFKYVQSVSGNNITTQTTFTNSYAVAGNVQLIKVPQYTTLTINAGASIIPKDWKDTTLAAVPYRFGGLVVIRATSIVNNGTITASGLGFRGGALFYSNGLNPGVTAFASALNSQGGEKGESIAGYQVDYDNNGGRYCLGAPANGGGGGNGHNASGGGGANGNNGNAWTGQGVMITNVNNPISAWSLSSGYAANGNALTTSSGGGHGGYSYGTNNANATIQGPGNFAWGGDPRREAGGIGGRPLNNINAETRIYFGGGGGAPHANDFASNAGSNGGGIIYLIATTGVTGSGSVLSNGLFPGNTTGCSCDGSPGAGAGGSIILKVGSIVTTQIIIANGGDGGNQLSLGPPAGTDESEGPGGGGGGGFVAISTGAIVPQINGGLNGTTLASAVAGEMTSNGATAGANGQTGIVSNAFILFTPLTVSPSAGSSITVCAGAAINLTTTAGASNYFWSGPNSFTSSIQNPIILNAGIVEAGNYTVTQSFSNCQPPAAYIVTVTIGSAPLITLNTNTTSLCSGEALSFSSSGGGSYLWSGPAGFTSNQQNPTLNSVTAANSGNYTLTVTSINNCTASVVSPNIIVAMTPILSVNGASVCINQPVNLTAITSATNFLWSGPNSFTSSSQTINFGSAGFNLSGNYSLLVTSSQGCTNIAVANVSVFPLPMPSISSNAPVCAGSTLNLNGYGGVTYIYNGPNNFTSTLQNPSINNVSSAATGIYTLTASNFGCSASATIAVSIFGSGKGTLTVSNDKQCVPFCSTFSINITGPSIVSASLNVNGQLFTGNTIKYCITNPGNYIISSSFKDSDGCLNSSTVALTGYPKPEADFIFSPLKPVENIDNVIFTNTSIGVNQTNWNWFFNSNTGYASSEQNTSYLFAEAGAYPVAMIVKNGWGCSDTIIKTAIVGNEYSLYVPNAFTPDGDGLNDEFYPKGTGITKYQLTIFDRWGELIFISKDFFKGWDGTFKGKPCQTDIYTWKINVNDPEGRTKEYVGHVTLYK